MAGFASNSSSQETPASRKEIETVRTSTVAVEPQAGRTVQLSTQAMATEFAVILNGEDTKYLSAASDALELVHELEDRLSFFRQWSELSQVNAQAAERPVAVKPDLFELLKTAKRIAEQTEGAFDPTSGPLLRLWRWCRKERRVPSKEELDAVLKAVGYRLVELKEQDQTVKFLQPETQLDLGAIGKGFAIDRIGEELDKANVTDWLVHGGYSSLKARGGHNGLDGWPVGLRHPLFPKKRMGTVLLREAALSTSGSGVQFFRVQGKRYGHILDPQTGWPAEGILSVTVIAPTATEADALSTAFYVAGVEKSLQIWNNLEDVGLILVPHPGGNRRLSPIVCGVPKDVLFFTDPQVYPVSVEEWFNSVAAF